MLSPEELGVDSRAAELLQKLSPDLQQEALSKLQDGMGSGKVRNASAYIAGIVNGPDGLGIDENASKLLRVLPKDAQKVILDKLRSSQEVRNPSAWVAKAALEAKRSSGSAFGFPVGGGFGPGAGGGYAMPLPHAPAYSAPRSFMPPPAPPVHNGHMLGAIDQSAQALLRSLAPHAQQDILTKLGQQSNVRNPSAWVAKAAIAAGATPVQGGGGGMPSPPSMPPRPAPQPYVPMPSSQMLWSIDESAKSLLQTLPHHVQQDILNKLATQTGVRNPSAWVAKSAMAAGATPIQGGPGGAGSPHGAQARAAPVRPAAPQASAVANGLDAQASALLQSLSLGAQDEILAKLQSAQSSGVVNNPSAWVAKACLKAGAQSSPGMGKDARHSPY